MDPFTLEVSVCRLGGTDLAERTFGPWIIQAIPGGMTVTSLHGRYRPSDSLTLWFGAWHVVRPGLYSSDLRIQGTVGEHVSGPRPVLFNALPCDTPLYSTHIANEPDSGVFSVGLRLPRNAWTNEDLKTQQAAATLEPHQLGGTHGGREQVAEARG
jgi:hypothetical protein